MSKFILFVCTGNTCRSPLAEGFANAEFKQRKIDCHAESAGLFAEAGGANEKSITAAAEYGVDITAHQARQLTPELINGATVIYTMTPDQANMLCLAFPDMSKKISPITPGGVPDPYGGTEGNYRQCAKQIKQAVGIIAERLADGTETG